MGVADAVGITVGRYGASMQLIWFLAAPIRHRVTERECVELEDQLVEPSMAHIWPSESAFGP